MPLGADQIGRPGAVGDRVPVGGVPRRFYLAVAEGSGGAGGGGGERVVAGGPVIAVEGHAQNDLARRYGRGILLHRGEVAEERRGERGGGLGPGGDVGRVLHDEEPVDGAGQGRNVVEPTRVAGRGRIGVHGHLPVRIHLVQRVRDRGHQPGQPGLVATALSFEVEIHPVETFGLDGADQRLGQGGGGGRVRGQGIEGVLVEVVDREHDPDAGPMGLGDQVRQRLALIAVPARPRLVQRSVGVEADGEVVERGQPGHAESPVLAQAPIGNEAEDLMG